MFRISIKVDDSQLRKEILSQEEMQLLISTKRENENPNIRRAFIFVSTAVCDFVMLKSLHLPMWTILISC